MGTGAIMPKPWEEYQKKKKPWEEYADEASPQAPPEKSAWDKITGGLWNILPQGTSAAMSIGSGILHPQDIGGPAVAQAITGPANLAAGAADAAMGGKSLMERLGYDPKSYKLPGREEIDKQ